MKETPKDAARRLARPQIDAGFAPEGLFEYTDATGNALYWRLRLKNPQTREKFIRPMYINGAGFELGEPKFEGKKPLYNLLGLAKNPAATVWICEGENKVAALTRLGLLAVSSGGCTSAAGAAWEALRGRSVVLWPDNDKPGKAYAGEVASILFAIGCSVRCIDVDKLGLAESGDAADWLAAHPQATAAEVEALPKLDPATENNKPNDAILYRRILDIEAKPIRWLWSGRIARGKVSMVAGNPGLGKSQLTLSLAAIVSVGCQWPVDRTRCERGAAIILSAEDDPEDTIRPRLEAAGADLSRVYILDAVRCTTPKGEPAQRAFNLAIDLSRLGALLCELRDVALVIIDPVSAYLGNADSHVNAEVRALMSPLGALAAEHGTAIVCVSHMNKKAAARR